MERSELAFFERNTKAKGRLVRVPKAVGEKNPAIVLAVWYRRWFGSLCQHCADSRELTALRHSGETAAGRATNSQPNPSERGRHENKAFVREADDERASNPLPDREISAEPNLVTPEGLAPFRRWSTWRKSSTLRRGTRAKQTRLRGPKGTFATGRQAGNGPGDEKERVVGGRGIRLIGHDQARGWGATRLSGSWARTRPIPRAGTLSYIAPLAKALLGRSKGDNIRVGERDAEIAKIE